MPKEITNPTAEKAEKDKTPKVMSPSKVAAIARAEAKEVVGKQVGGFTNFLREQSVVGVGIGIVFGVQVKAVVDAVMNGFVNPITQLVLPHGASLKDQVANVDVFGKTVAIGWGAITYSLITFVIVALIIYATYKLLKLDKLKKQT